MGILRNRSINRIPIRIEECAENENGFADDYANDDAEEENEVPVKIQSQPIGGHRRKKTKSYRPIEIMDGFPLKRNMGAQKWRRVENTRLLTSFADTQDICFDGSDLIPETISAFSRLLRDEAKMKVWNDFLEKDESGQKKMLLQFEYEILMARDASKAQHSQQSVKNTDIKKSENQPHNKNGQPSSGGGKSSSDCFQRLDKKFRDCLLKRRNVQFDCLYRMEFALREFFGESPADVYAEEIISRAKRFHLHAVAQFLRLNSKTVDGENCTKIVQVKNEENEFSPPGTFLATLLKKKRKTNSSKGDEWVEWDAENGTL
ncbi:hypothetical protein niasHT_000661 [Heterodera trifolii]|uniref:R3H-associated N-terminal domain-containing protein n=1 Tax=Heterodera trifolii TaxID=157864 RepID=A0ABD2MC27_9BILA